MRPACEVFSDRRSPTGRKILSEIELPLRQEPEARVRAWLEESLNPLNLNAGFIHRILDSARDAVARLASPDGPAAQHGHIHVIISSPQLAGAAPETWGFFRIEKLESDAREDAGAGHSIEFYLYVEGA